MISGLTDYITVAAVVLVPWIFWKAAGANAKNCCPECIESGLTKNPNKH
jgi:hypothetical protein